MTRSDTATKISVEDLKPGMKFRYSGRKYSASDVIIEHGVGYVYTTRSIFPMEFHPEDVVNLVTAPVSV